MKIHKLLLTKNQCYKIGTIMKPKGIMVHSTAVNNPKLSRYVGPDDGKLGANKYGNHWNVYHPGGKDIGDHAYSDKNKDGVCDTCGGRQVCVHAFIGKLADGTIATYQTLPWDYRGWHAGKSTGNDSYIGFEICEANITDKDYFNKIYQETINLCVYLCKMFNFDPLEEGVLICHSEGYKKGIASNHSDVMHWFPKHGKSMNTLREDVAQILNRKVEESTKKEELTFKINDVVNFRGTTHYVSPTAIKGVTTKSGRAKITDISEGSKHPYHLRAIDKDGKFVYGVYGWVDSNTVSHQVAFKKYLVKITANSLNIRKGPGVSYSKVGVIKDKGVYTIIAESNGWGLLSSNKGWISLSYTQKLKYL